MIDNKAATVNSCSFSFYGLEVVVLLKKCDTIKMNDRSFLNLMLVVLRRQK